VDTAVFLGALPRLLESTKSLEELLNEVIASAGDRAVDPTSMERSIVQSIAEEKLAKLTF
jgi:hypothetical protein